MAVVKKKTDTVEEAPVVKVADNVAVDVPLHELNRVNLEVEARLKKEAK